MSETLNMPLRGGRLTPKEVKFAEVFARTDDVAYAAQKANYRNASAGHHALARPAVADQVAAVREKYLAKGVALAYERTIGILEDRKARNVDVLTASKHMFQAAQQFQPNATRETPVEELGLSNMLLEVNRTLFHLIEHRPGEFGMAEVEPKGGVFD